MGGDVIMKISIGGKSNPYFDELEDIVFMAGGVTLIAALAHYGLEKAGMERAGKLVGVGTTVGFMGYVLKLMYEKAQAIIWLIGPLPW